MAEPVVEGPVIDPQSAEVPRRVNPFVWVAGWLGLDAAKQTTLFRLRVRLKVRQFTSESGTIVGILIALLTMGPVVLIASIGTTLGYWRLDPPWNSELLGGTLVLLWLIWLLMPLLAFSTNEALDISRLLVYPLRARDLFVATLFGTLFDFPTYLLIPLFIAIFLGWGANLALPVVVVALLLSYAHMVISSQLVLLTASGLLQSRKFRDLSIVLISFLGFSCYFINQLIRWLLAYIDIEQLATLRPLLILQWLPPGAAARAIERATANAWIEALAWLLYASLLLVVVAWAWRYQMMALITGHRTLRAPAQGREIQHKRTGRSVTDHGFGAFQYKWLVSRVPFDIRRIFVNELRSVWRLPQRRIGLLQAFLIPIFLIAVTIFNEEGFQARAMEFVTDSAIEPWLALILPGYSIFSVWIMGINMLGWESKGLPSLLVTPVARWRIFVGKGFGLILVTVIPLSLIGTVSASVLGSWLVASSVLGAVGISCTVIGVSAVTSVLFPYPVNPDAINRQMNFSRGGCITSLANAFVVPMLIVVLCLPIFALLVGAALGSIWWGNTWLLTVSMLCAVGYGAAAFWFGCRFAGDLLIQREPEVLLATRLTDG